MEYLPEDQKIVDLLTKLKNSNGAYPSDMLATRRKTYLRQLANVGLGIGVGAGLGHAAKGGNGAAVATSTATSKILEAALIAAIVIEAGTAAFLYRDKIAEAVSSLAGGPAVQQVSSQEITSPSEGAASPPFEIEATGTPLVTMSETPSAMPSGFPSLEPAGEDDQSGNLNGTGDNGSGSTETNGGVTVNATPNPNGNQGNHYGLTPKPERTKENNGGNNNGGGGGGGANDGGGDNNNSGGGGGGNNGNGGGNNKP